MTKLENFEVMVAKVTNFEVRMKKVELI